jgi:hypothetical protein
LFELHDVVTKTLKYVIVSGPAEREKGEEENGESIFLQPLYDTRHVIA